MGPQFVTIRTMVQTREKNALQTRGRRVLTFRKSGDSKRDRVMFSSLKNACPLKQYKYHPLIRHLMKGYDDEKFKTRFCTLVLTAFLLQFCSLIPLTDRRYLDFDKEPVTISSASDEKDAA